MDVGILNELGYLENVTLIIGLELGDSNNVRQFVSWVNVIWFIFNKRC